MHDHSAFSAKKVTKLNDPRRLDMQLDQATLVRLLGLEGHEDVADLGSGTGFYTDVIAAHTDGSVYAVEFHPEMHEAYRERGVPSNVRLVLGDVRDAPLADRSVDVAVSIAVHHEIGGDMGLPRLLRALRPAGRLVIIDWRRDPESWDWGPAEEIRFVKEDVATSLRPHFDVVNTENVGRFMFAVVGAGLKERP